MVQKNRDPPEKSATPCHPWAMPLGWRVGTFRFLRRRRPTSTRSRSMIRYSCDLCKRDLDPEDDLRYVVKMEVYAAFDPAAGERRRRRPRPSPGNPGHPRAPGRRRQTTRSATTCTSNCASISARSAARGSSRTRWAARSPSPRRSASARIERRDRGRRRSCSGLGASMPLAACRRSHCTSESTREQQRRFSGSPSSAATAPGRKYGRRPSRSSRRSPRWKASATS